MRSIIKSNSQKGAALLIFMLILVIASSYSLISKLNSATKPYQRDLETSRALAEAKKALIGYAVTYPDKVNANSGPGYLPCPDLNNDGSAEGSCALGGPVNRTIGRFPNETLNTVELRDASGQKLWYAVSDNYRNFAGLQPLNSDTPGQLNIDVNANGIIDVPGEGDISDIVAVIIAPGAPVIGQTRDFTETDITVEISNYLEIDNNDLDTDFVAKDTTGNTNVFNDTVVTITRQELMEVVEKRVLSEVENAIINYQTTLANGGASVGSFPWLSTFSNPDNSAFRAPRDASSDPVPTYQGFLPFHWAADPSFVAEVNPFDTKVSWSWNIDTGTANINPGASTIGVDTVGIDCLEEIDCTTDAIFTTVITEITSNWSPVSVDCTWTNLNTADCDPAWVLRGPVNCDLGCGNANCYRAYRIDFPIINGIGTINNPTATEYRTRSVSLTGTLTPQANAIRIVDGYDGLSPATGCVSNGPFWHHFTSLEFLATTEGTIAIGGIQYDLDIDNNELPLWFVTNEWHKLIYVSYASGEPLPGDTTAGQDCDTLGGPCLTVNDSNGNSITNVRAAVISAGMDLNGTRPTAQTTDYFEDENAAPIDDVFVKNRISNSYNDQTRIISTAP